MRPTKGRAAGLLTAAGLALSLVVPAAAAQRHEAAISDPVSTHHPSFRAGAWVEPGANPRAGGQLTVAPPRRGDPPPIAPPDGGDGGPSIPTDPEAVHLPTVEAPDDAAGAHLPDLVALPAWDVHLDVAIVTVSAAEVAVATAQRRDPFASPAALRFGTTIVNRGKHSLEVIGAPVPTPGAGGPVRVNANQCVRFAGPRVEGSGRVCQTYEPVGSLAFHPEHGHFHIDGFAQYRLLRDVGGTPGPVVARSDKTGFCLGDTDWHGPAYGFALDTGWYRECRHTTPHVPATLRQGISPNWADSYPSDLPGQHIPLKGVADGVYWVAITVNAPAGKTVAIHETTRANNTSYQRVRIFRERGIRVARAF